MNGDGNFPIDNFISNNAGSLFNENGERPVETIDLSDTDDEDNDNCDNLNDDEIISILHDDCSAGEEEHPPHHTLPVQSAVAGLDILNGDGNQPAESDGYESENHPESVQESGRNGYHQELYDPETDRNGNGYPSESHYPETARNEYHSGTYEPQADRNGYHAESYDPQADRYGYHPGSYAQASDINGYDLQSESNVPEADRNIHYPGPVSNGQAEESENNDEETDPECNVLDVDLFDVGEGWFDSCAEESDSESTMTSSSDDYEEIDFDLDANEDPISALAGEDEEVDSDDSDDYHEQRISKLRFYLRGDNRNHNRSDSEEEDLIETLFEDNDIFKKLLPSLSELGIKDTSDVFPKNPDPEPEPENVSHTGPEVITLGDENDDDALNALDETKMVCHRCLPRSSVFFKKTTFLLHRRRHVARHHFACPICKKGFTKLSFCLAHEFKVHQSQDENLNPNDHPKLLLKLMKCTQTAKADAEKSGPGTSIDKTGMI